MLNAGDLRERVVHKREVATRVKGAEQRNTEQVGAYWAAVRFINTRERLNSQQMQSTANVELRMHYRTNILASDYFEWSGYRLEVRGEPMPDQDRSGVTVMCEAKRA